MVSGSRVALRRVALCRTCMLIPQVPKAIAPPCPCPLPFSPCSVTHLRLSPPPPPLKLLPPSCRLPAVWETRPNEPLPAPAKELARIWSADTPRYLARLALACSRQKTNKWRAAHREPMNCAAAMPSLAPAPACTSRTSSSRQVHYVCGTPKLTPHLLPFLPQPLRVVDQLQDLLGAVPHIHTCRKKIQARWQGWRGEQQQPVWHGHRHTSSSDLP